MEFAILKGRDPKAMDTIKLRSTRYRMTHYGCGDRMEKAYIAGAVDMLNAMGYLAL